jgi:hypothetical protein
MTRRCRLLPPILLCDLSLTSSRHLDRLFTHSEAPFWTARNQCRFRLLHSDYPLYSTSFEWPGLNPNRLADQSLLPICAERWLLGLSSFMVTTGSLQAVAVVLASRVPMFLGLLGFSVCGGCCFPSRFSCDLVTVKFSSSPAILQQPLSASRCLLPPVSTELDNHNCLRKENIHVAQSRTFTI